MNVKDTLELIEQLEFANYLPKNIQVEDISGSQVKISGKWCNPPYTWGIMYKMSDFIYFETDECNGSLIVTEVFLDEDGACHFATERMKMINHSLASKTPLEKTVRFIMREYGYSREIADQMGEKLFRHKEVFEEFNYHTQMKCFCKADGTRTKVCGYTAQELYDNYNLSPLGAYNYLVYLLDDQDNALEDLKKGLRTR